MTFCFWSPGECHPRRSLALEVSHRTVKHQVEAIKRKLGARNLAHAVALATTENLLGR
jgi:DNA-binding NarL/FixJ family response regulator